MTFSHLTPLFRHNLLFGLQVGTKIRHVGEKEEVNTPRKPARGVCQRSTPVQVWILCAGHWCWLGEQGRRAGSLGVHVAALGQGPKQFWELTPRLTAEASSPVKALKQAADGEETCELFRVLAMGCTRIIRDRQSHFVQAVEDDADDDSAPSSSSSSPAVPAAESKCLVCDKPWR